MNSGSIGEVILWLPFCWKRRNKMVTYEAKMVDDKKDKFDFRCLSGDTKPTKTCDGRKIANGSTCTEINTGSNFMYDEEHEKWEPSTP
jgi:hypothetical protein